MYRQYLQSKIKSSGRAYVFWVFLGLHYAYLEKWEKQFLFWITFGGLGIWALADLFTLSEKVNAHNKAVFREIESLNRREQHRIV